MVGAKYETEIITISKNFSFFNMTRMNSFFNVSLLDLDYM